MVAAGSDSARVWKASGVMRASGLDAGAEGADHAGAADAAVAGRVPGQVLLVVVLGEVEGAGRRDLGGDRAQAAAGQALAVGLPCGLRRPLLVDGIGVDRRAVLAADVVALAHALGRVVVLPEDLEQLIVGGLPGV